MTTTIPRSCKTTANRYKKVTPSYWVQQKERQRSELNPCQHLTSSRIADRRLPDLTTIRRILDGRTAAGIPFLGQCLFTVVIVTTDHLLHGNLMRHARMDRRFRSSSYRAGRTRHRARRTRPRRARHQARSQLPRRRRDRLQARLPPPQILLGVVQDLARVLGVLERMARVAGNDGRVVEKVEQTATVAGQEGLLLRPFDSGGEVHVVGLFELLTGLVFHHHHHQ